MRKNEKFLFFFFVFAMGSEQDKNSMLMKIFHIGETQLTTNETRIYSNYKSLPFPSTLMVDLDRNIKFQTLAKSLLKISCIDMWFF